MRPALRIEDKQNPVQYQGLSIASCLMRAKNGSSCAREVYFRITALYFPGRIKRHVRPSLFCQLQIDPAVCQIDEKTTTIFRKIIMSFFLEFVENLRIITTDPSGSHHWHIVINTSTLYSAFNRNAVTSNCKTPTAPNTKSLLRNGLKSCVAPSSVNCTKPF